MSVVGLHPEELLDKWARGELSASERVRLDAHLEGCSVCRIELELRRDFELEATKVGLAKMPDGLLASHVAPHRRAASRRHSRWVVWGLTGAGVVAATAAVASSLTWARAWQDRSNDAAGSASVRHAQPPKRVAARSASTSEYPSASDSEPETTVSAPPLDAPGTHASAPTARVRRVPDARRAPSPVSLFAAANLARRQGELGTATKLYRLLQARFPASDEARLSLVTFAKLELDRGNGAAALASFDQYVSRAEGPLEAEALVGRATALERLGRRRDAAAAWRTVAERYPGSTYARQANERLSALGGP